MDTMTTVELMGYRYQVERLNNGLYRILTRGAGLTSLAHADGSHHAGYLHRDLMARIVRIARKTIG